METAAAKVAESLMVPLAGAKKLHGDGPHAVSACGVDLVLVRTKAGPRVFLGRCPHQGALLGEGEIDGDTLVCRNHRWRFRTDSGKRQGGPQCLVACPVVEEQGEILVDVSLFADDRKRASGVRTAGPGSRRIHDLPGPRGLPFLGNTPQIDLGTIHQTVERWAAQYGPLYVFRMGRRPTLVVSDPDLSQQILRARPETYRRMSKLEPVFNELGVGGVFSAEGTAWRPQRRLAMEALSHRHLRDFYPTLHIVAQRLCKRWETAADRGEPIDMVEELKRFTVDVTTALTFGQDVNTIEQAGDDVIQRRLELLFPAFQRRLFALVPLWRFIRLPRDRRLERALAELRTWLGGLVREARARLLEDCAQAEHPSNFLFAMLAARDDAGQPFSDQVIFGNLLTMLLAGEDTTAYSLAWAVHHLCDSPDSVHALRVELDLALGSTRAPVDIETANRLIYAGAVANEAMRLRPIAPLLFFETIVSTVLADLEIPAKTSVLVLTRPPVRDPDHFDAPTAFRPERWLDGSPLSAGQAAAGAHDPSTHIPFGSGPRICPGRTLALLEMKVVLSVLYKTFEVARHGRSEDVREAFSFTMAPTNLKVSLRHRTSTADTTWRP
jgi:cytochrome P450/nitrite reductase/ring-hydroxylating ferredoxin subunit